MIAMLENLIFTFSDSNIQDMISGPKTFSGISAINLLNGMSPFELLGNIKLVLSRIQLRMIICPHSEKCLLQFI